MGPLTGWVSSVLGHVAETLVDVQKLIKTLITLAHVIHVDETSSSKHQRRALVAAHGRHRHAHRLPRRSHSPRVGEAVRHSPDHGQQALASPRN